jgi:hypothetical protein
MLDFRMFHYLKSYFLFLKVQVNFLVLRRIQLKLVHGLNALNSNLLEMLLDSFRFCNTRLCLFIRDTVGSDLELVF